MKTYITTQAELQDCDTGCPVEVYRILVDGWADICETGRLTKECTPIRTVLMEIQPQSTGDGGEKITCEVNGLNVDVNYQFWYEPQGNFLVTTPQSQFISNSFDSTVFIGGWTIVRWLGQDWMVIHLKNDTGACNDVCGDIVMQRGGLIPLNDCFRHKDTTTPREEDNSIPDDDEWVAVS